MNLFLFRFLSIPHPQRYNRPMNSRLHIDKVLLATKVSLYELYGLRRRDSHLLALLSAHDPLVAKVQTSHEETANSRDQVRRTLKNAGISVVQTRRLSAVAEEGYDLIIVVGGDGTVLDVARRIMHTPMLAVNSSPSASVGHFCCATAQTLPTVLEEIRRGDRKPTPLTRIRVAVNDVAVPFVVLNDVLIAHQSPAATSRYILHVGDRHEEQKSSGVWVSTAAGSTGAILSAGGHAQDLRDNRLQYVVREPFAVAERARPYALTSGMIGAEGLRFTARMMKGESFLDGRRAAIRLPYAARVTITPDAPPLHLFLP